MREGVADRFPREADPRLVDWFCRRTGACDLGWLGRFAADMSSRDWEGELPRTACPTLIVARGEEPIGSHDQYESRRDRIPRSELPACEGMPHNVGDAAPGRCARDLLAFLERCGSGA